MKASVATSEPIETWSVQKSLTTASMELPNIMTKANAPSRIMRDTRGVRPHPVLAATSCFAMVKNRMLLCVTVDIILHDDILVYEINKDPSNRTYPNCITGRRDSTVKQAGLKCILGMLMIQLMALTVTSQHTKSASVTAIRLFLLYRA